MAGQGEDVAGSKACFSLSLGKVVEAADVSPRLKMRSEKLAVLNSVTVNPGLLSAMAVTPSGSSSFSASEDNHPKLRSKRGRATDTVTFAPGPWAHLSLFAYLFCTSFSTSHSGP